MQFGKSVPAIQDRDLAPLRNARRERAIRAKASEAATATEEGAVARAHELIRPLDFRATIGTIRPQEQRTQRFELTIVAPAETPAERTVGRDETPLGAAERAVRADPEERTPREYRNATGCERQGDQALSPLSRK